MYNYYFIDTSPTQIYTLSLHDTLPISLARAALFVPRRAARGSRPDRCDRPDQGDRPLRPRARRRADDVRDAEHRSEEHTSELQSRRELVCRLLLEKKK